MSRRSQSELRPSINQVYWSNLVGRRTRRVVITLPFTFQYNPQPGKAESVFVCVIGGGWNLEPAQNYTNEKKKREKGKEKML